MKRTNISAFVLGSENRLKIVRALLASPIRLWSCSALEDATKLPHATVFRTIQRLGDFGILRSLKINRRDLAYELVQESPFLKALEKTLSFHSEAIQSIIGEFTAKVSKEGIVAVLLYGSCVSGEIKPESDIDLLVVLQHQNTIREKNIFDVAAAISTKINNHCPSSATPFCRNGACVAS